MLLDLLDDLRRGDAELDPDLEVAARLRAAEVDHERHQVLLGSVVDVSLQAAPFGVVGVDQPLARQLELVSTRRELIGAPGKLRPEPRATQNQPGLGGKAREQALLDR